MSTHRNLGDALKADKIVASARRVNPVRVNHRTSKHRGQFIDLRDNAYCVIEIPLKQVVDKK